MHGFGLIEMYDTACFGAWDAILFAFGIGGVNPLSQWNCE
jgi:hypothetical protein